MRDEMLEVLKFSGRDSTLIKTFKIAFRAKTISSINFLESSQ